MYVFGLASDDKSGTGDCKRAFDKVTSEMMCVCYFLVDVGSLLYKYELKTMTVKFVCLCWFTLSHKELD